jgi:hypothetical protein
MKSILELIKLIYGSKALSKILGTRTNVIRLPDNELKQYTKSDLNIEAASDKLAQKAKADMKELLADYPRMNDAEKLIFEGNLRRLGNKLGVTEKGSAADVLEFGTGEKVSPEGIMSLTEKAGQKSPPTTLMGKLESRIKQLEASGEDLSKMKGQTYDEFMNDITQGQRTMIKLEDEGLVRATAREIIDKDIKSKKIKLPKEIEADFKQGGGEPIDVFRQFYGEDALEQLNSMVPDFKQMYSSKEAAEAAIKKFKFKFKADRPPGSISIEDAKKAEQEFNIVPADSEEGKVITEKLIGKPKASVTELVTAEKIILDMKNMDPMDAMKEANKVLKREGKYKNLKEEDVERIMEDTNDFIFGRDIPEDPEGFAVGGRVEMAGGGVTKLIKKAMEFFSDNDPVSAYKKYLKYVKETAQKDPAKLVPEVGGVVVGSELINRGLRRKLKEAKEKNDTDDSEDTTIEDRAEKAGGGISQGLDYLMGINRTSFQEGGTTEDKELSDPTMTSMVMPSIRGIQNFLSNPVVQGVGSFMLGGLPALGNYAKGQVGGYLAGKAISPMVQARLAAESFRDSTDGPFGGYNDFDGTEGTFSTDSSDTGASSGGVDSAGDGGDGYATGGRVSNGLDYLSGVERRGYQEGSVSQEGVIPGFEKIRDTVYFNSDGTPNLEKIKAANFLAGSSINEFGYRDIKTGDVYGPSTYTDIASGRYPRIFDPSKYTIGPDNNYYEVDSIITDGGLRYRINADGSRTLLDTPIEQTTPTEDFSDYLNTTTINTNVQTTPAVEEQMISPEDALTPPVPDVDPLQQHFEQNQMLKDAVARGEITPEQYNQLGGYDVQQTLSPGNPVLGGIGNLIGSTGYNVVQSSIPSKDSSGNVIYEDTPFIIGEDANTIYSQTPKASQLLRDIPGDVMRNVQGGFGLISPELKQTYQDIVKRQLPYMDQYQKDYQTRISQVDPNALRNRYLENLQNTSSQDINQFQSQLRSNLVPRENQPQGLDYLTGL